METRYRRMPKDLLKKPGYKLIKLRGRYFVAYAKLKNKGAKRIAHAKPAQLKLMYEMKREIGFKPRWDLERQVRGVFERLYGKVFRERIRR